MPVIERNDCAGCASAWVDPMCPVHGSGIQSLPWVRARVRQLPADFGEGWMSAPARDLMRVALLAGFDAHELGRRIALASHQGTTNARTVERIMGEMEREANAR
jgi:hypothetical protein